MREPAGAWLAEERRVNASEGAVPDRYHCVPDHGHVGASGPLGIAIPALMRTGVCVTKSGKPLVRTTAFAPSAREFLTPPQKNSGPMGC